MGIVSTASTILGTEGAGAAGGGTGGTGAGGVTTQQLADAIAAREIAQLARDQAQDQFAEAEELDDDTKNLAQDNLIQANEDLINANALVESNREIARNAEQLLQNDRIISLENLFTSNNVLPVAANGIIAVWISSNSNQQQIVAPDYYVTDNPSIAGHKSSIVLVDGAATTIYLIGRQYLEGGATPGTATIGTTYEVTNTGGVLTAVPVAGMWMPDSDFSVTAWNDLTNTQNSGLNTASVNPNLLFSGDGIAADLSLLHDGGVQDERLDELENTTPPEAYDDTELRGRLDTIDSDQVAQNDALQVEQSARVAAIAAIGNPDQLVRTIDDQTVNGRKSFIQSIELLGDNVASLFWRIGGLIRSRELFGREIVEVVTEGQAGEPSKTLTIGGFEVALTAEDKIIQPSTLDADPGNSSASKDYVDSKDVAISAALQSQIDSIVSSLPVDQTVAQALAADMAALASEISDTDADFAQAFADLVANRTDIDANTAQAQINASGLATEIGDRQQADIALQSNIDTEIQNRTQADTALQNDIDTRDAQNVKLTGAQVIEDIKTFMAGIIARAGVRFEDANGLRVTLLSPVSVTEEYSIRLPDRPPLQGQVLGFPDAANMTQGQWVYPFGFGFQLFEPDDIVNTVNDMDAPEALIQVIDTTDFVEGLWKIEVECKFGYDSATTDYIAGLYDEAGANKNDGGGYDNSLDYIRKEPKDIAGTDPSGAGAGTDQFEIMNLSAFVRVVAGENKVYSFRQRPGNVGIEATAHNIKVTVHRVRD